jgi:hypothetical protein
MGQASAPPLQESSSPTSASGPPIAEAATWPGGSSAAKQQRAIDDRLLSLLSRVANYPDLAVGKLVLSC